MGILYELASSSYYYINTAPTVDRYSGTHDANKELHTAPYIYIGKQIANGPFTLATTIYILTSYYTLYQIVVEL